MTDPITKPDRWTCIKRGLQLRCPECGISPVLVPTKNVRRLYDWMFPLDGCPRCGYAYEREPGYFLISIWAVNYGVIGGLGVAALFLVDNVFHPPLWETMCMVLPAIPLANFLFIRHAKALFLAMDHYMDPHVKPKVDPTQRLS